MTNKSSNWPPPTGWRKGRILRPAAARTTGLSAGHAFQALLAPGVYAPAVANPTWSLHCGLDPQDGSLRIWMLPNGLAAKSAHSNDILLVLFAVDAGVLHGYADSSIPAPSLFSPELAVQTVDNGQWLGAGPHYVALSHARIPEGLFFAVALSTESHTQALHKASEALQRDAREVVQAEMDRRETFIGAAQTQLTDETLMIEAYDTLVAALRSPEGALPHRWSESEEGAGIFSVNELYPLISAWCMQDGSVAEDLFRTVCSAMRPSGFVPARIRTNGNHDHSAQAWPTLAMCAKTIAEHGASDEFMAYALPRLAAYLGHALDQFSQGNHYVWRSPEESFIPETFDLNLATVDLTVFLLCEIDAFLEMAGAHDRDELIAPLIHMHRDRLSDHLATHLWDGEKSVFRDCYANGNPIKRTTLAGYLPLMLQDPDQSRRAQTLKRLQQEIATRKDGGLGLWEWWESDPQRPSARAWHQNFALQAARHSGQDEVVRRLETKLMSALVQGYNRTRIIPNELSGVAEAASGANTSSVMGAALVVLVAFPLHFGSHDERAPVSQTVRWLDRHRIAVIGTVLSMLVLALSVVILTYQFKRTPTAVEMETISGLAERYYLDGRVEEAVTLYRELARIMPDNPVLHFRLANALYRQGKYAEAEHHYRRSLDDEMPSPRTLRNLAITLHQQGKHREAAYYFEIIATHYPRTYPQLAEHARTALDILEPLVELEQ